MNAEVIIENSSGINWCHPEGKIIHHKIHNFMPIDEFHDFLMIGARTLKEKWADK